MLMGDSLVTVKRTVWSLWWVWDNLLGFVNPLLRVVHHHRRDRSIDDLLLVAEIEHDDGVHLDGTV